MELMDNHDANHAIHQDIQGPTFANLNRLFVLLFKNEHENDNENESVRTSFKKYYVSKVKVKDFNVLENHFLKFL